MKNFIEVFVVYYIDSKMTKVVYVRGNMFIPISSISDMCARCDKESKSIIEMKSGKSYHIKETLDELKKILQ